jgi:ribosome maturation protein Sdo1
LNGLFYDSRCTLPAAVWLVEVVEQAVQQALAEVAQHVQLVELAAEQVVRPLRQLNPLRVVSVDSIVYASVVFSRWQRVDLRFLGQVVRRYALRDSSL